MQNGSRGDLHAATAAMIASTFCFGLGSVLSKIVLNNFSAFALLSIQLFASICFLWVLVWRRQAHRHIDRAWRRMALIGIVNPGFGFLFALLALNLTSASVASLIWATQPILIIVLAWILLRERPSWKLIILGSIAISGAFVIAGADFSSDNSAFLGNLFAFASALCVAIYVIMMRQAGSSMDPILSVAILQTSAFVLSLVLLPMSVFLIQDQSLEMSITTGLLAVVSGVVYYGIAFWLYVLGLRKLSAGRAGLFLNLSPVFTIVLSFLLLSERLSGIQWVGAGMVFAAVISLSLDGFISQKPGL